MKKVYCVLCLLVLSFFSIPSFAEDVSVEGNTKIESFEQAKNDLLTKVYFDHRFTFYCNASFNKDKSINLPEGFMTNRYYMRSKKLEWEHVVPAEKFGSTFIAWKDSDENCGNYSFRGRKCATKVSKEYRLIQADMYNLYPAIGAVNALRQNYEYTQFDENMNPSFGSCEMCIYSGLAEPPVCSRGAIARTYLYMTAAYPRHVRMSPREGSLMQRWNKEYPVDEWECIRARRIREIQGNVNPVVEEACRQRKFDNQ